MYRSVLLLPVSVWVRQTGLVSCVCVCVCTILVIGRGGELFRKGWRGGLQLGKQIIHQAEIQKKINQTTGVPSLLCVILGLRLKFKHELVS